jgi:hypothetical protein
VSSLLAPSFVKVLLVLILFVLPQVSLGVIVELMRFIIRLELQKTMQQEIALLTDQFDQALCATFASLRRTNIGAEEWWNIYGKEASLVVDAQTVKQLLDAGTGSWAAYASQIANLCALSSLGKRLFGWAQPFIISEKVATMINDAIKKVSGRITKAMSSLRAGWVWGL